MGPWSTELFVLGCGFCFDLIFLEVGRGGLCGLSNVLFIKSRAWAHVQFAMVGDVQEACVHPCPRCDWHLHSEGRKGDLCPGYASANLGSVTYSSWICQNEFSSFGIQSAPEILVWKEARLGDRNRRSFAKVHAACRDLRALDAMTQVYLLCLF